MTTYAMHLLGKGTGMLLWEEGTRLPVQVNGMYRLGGGPGRREGGLPTCLHGMKPVQLAAPESAVHALYSLWMTKLDSSAL